MIVRRRTIRTRAGAEADLASGRTSLAGRRVDFADWKASDGREVPTLKVNDAGLMTQVTKADQAIAARRKAR